MYRKTYHSDGMKGNYSH